jgi:hypothetical protein
LIAYGPPRNERHAKTGLNRAHQPFCGIKFHLDLQIFFLQPRLLDKLEGAPLGRNRYVELEVKKPKANGASTKLPANQKPCEKMAEAIVMDGGKRGQVVKVCADPACRVHHPDTPSPQQVERERAEERKRIEKEKPAITTRHRILATILERVSAPLEKADLLAVAHYLIGHLYLQPSPGSGEAAQARGEEGLCVRTGTSGQASGHVR